MSARSAVMRRDELLSRNLRVAHRLYREGEFQAAETYYSTVLDRDAENLQALVGLGNLLLLSNRTTKAKRILTTAVSLKPDAKPIGLLAETLYRLNDFSRAAPLFKAVGKEAKAAKLKSFGSETPYQTNSAVEGRTAFVQTDPLPLVRLLVNGEFRGYFLIDTGASELILDTQFAKRVGAAEFGSEEGIFAGGKKANYTHGRIDSIEIGELIIRNLPIQLMDTQHFSGVAGGRIVSGIIGTVLLYHFATVLDYPLGELVLHRQEGSGGLGRSAFTQSYFHVPLWMAGDHYMVAKGSVNERQPILLYLDTGLVGGGFTCPKSTLDEADITLERESMKGIGAGGTFEVFPFRLRTLSLGGVREREVSGLFGPFSPDLEYRFGFRIGGLLSHGFFRNHKVSFDFRQMTLHLSRRFNA